MFLFVCVSRAPTHTYVWAVWHYWLSLTLSHFVHVKVQYATIMSLYHLDVKQTIKYAEGFRDMRKLSFKIQILF